MNAQRVPSIWRTITKNKAAFIVNLCGLSIGMTVFLLIALYVHFERSFENFIAGKENIYRVTLESHVHHETVLATAENYTGVGPALQRELPEVASYARLLNMGYKNNVVITYKDAIPEAVAFKQRRFLYADSSFLPMMGYTMIRGNSRTALAKPLTAVISEKYAALYFRNEDPLGKTLLLQDDDRNVETATVTGVFKELPSNTHLKFDVLFSYETLFLRGDWARSGFNEDWRRSYVYTYIQLRPGTDPQKLEAQLPAVVNKYKPEAGQTGKKDVLRLQPLKNIHLQSDLADELETNGNARRVWFLSLVGLFVLVIAWINYVNLSTAWGIERARELGVRKVIGAGKGQLIRQLFKECALVNLFSAAAANFLVCLALPFFNALSGHSFSLRSLADPWYLLVVLLLWVVGTLLSGFYPALVLSSYKPLPLLSGKLMHGSRSVLLRKGLIVAQFVASIVLITGTIIIYRQLHHMMDRNIGMNLDQVMVVERPAIVNADRNLLNASIDLFRNELKKTPLVAAVSNSLTVPGKQREYKMLVRTQAGGMSDSVIVRANSMDFDFMNVYKMQLIAGRSFSPDFPGNPEGTVIITESAARELGFQNPAGIVGQEVILPRFGNEKRVVIGVVNDYHQVSLKKLLDPGLFIFDRYHGEVFSVRIHQKNVSKALADIRRAWTKAFPGNPFEYFFLDEYFNQQYASEQKFGKLFMIFAFLSIFICCLGLLSLSAYTVNRRTKEIGIRRVLGASVPDIIHMLSGNFLPLIIIAIVLAVPVAWYIMVNWLQQFPYRVPLSWWTFAAAGLGALTVALLTVSFHSFRAAVANPVKNLRTE